VNKLFLIEDEVDTQKQEALKRNRVGALAGVFSKALSVLTTHKISVNVVDRKDMNAPAWSSTKEVWLNLAQIKDDFTARSITSLNGLSFHELGHLRYTPRNGSNLVQLIKDEQEQDELWQAFNCLEDSRIEFLLTGWLPSIKSWLTATMCDYLLSDDEAISRAFPLVYGRKYLPVELRQLASDKFIKPEIQQELADVIDEYNSLVFSGNDEYTEQVFNLIKKFSELLKELPSLTQEVPNAEGEGTTVIRVRIKSPHGHEGRPTQGYESSSNRPASAKEQQRNRQSAQKNVVEVVIDTTPKEETKENVSEGKNPSDTQSQQQSQSESKDNSFGDVSDEEFGDLFDDSDFDDVQSQSDIPSQSNKAGNTKGETGTNQQVTDTLNDILSNVIDSLSKDINSIANQIGVNPELDGGNAKTPDKANYNEVRIPDELAILAKQFGVELERLRADYDPAWLNGERSGKLNVTRYLRGDELDSVFDEWTEGRDDVTSIEAVILLDRSGSMSGNNADNAYKSMWAIKKALERVEARTTVVTFDYGTYLLYGADEKAGTTIRDSGASGGTNPEKAIMYAKNVLANSDKAIKLLFMITDGEWDTTTGEQAVKDMKSAGVLTCQALITGREQVSAETLNQYRHGFELMTSMKSAKDILILGKDLVRLAVGRNLLSA
jgi:uncharacterized protein YegL